MFVSEIYKLFLRERLCENVIHLLINGDILEPHHSLMYHITNKLVLEINMFYRSMKHYIVCELHIALTITEQHSRSKHLVEQATLQLMNPYSLTMCNKLQYTLLL